MKIAFFGTFGVTDDIRLKNPMNMLNAKKDYEVDFGYYAQWEDYDTDTYDAFVLSRPPIEAVDIIDKIKSAGKRLIVDIDDDFFTIPVNNPAYKYLGKGNPNYLDKLVDMMGQADVLVVASEYMKENYKQYNDNIVLIPNGWSKTNNFWGKRYRIDNKFNFGWCGTTTHRIDFRIILPVLIEYFSSRQDTRIIIGADPDIYNMLKDVPEHSKLFLPALPYSHYPLMLARFDAMLVPLVDDEFNRYKSDIKMVDSAVAGIPWIASPLPQYTGWKVGGHIAKNDATEWIKYMDLVMDNGIEYYAKESKAKGESREAEQLFPLWEQILL